MIPELDAEGLLPEGVHEAHLWEVRERFGRFSESDQRIRLQEKLERFLEEAESSELGLIFYVDGSFVTAKSEPSDVDLILELPDGHDWAAELRPAQYNVLSKRRVKARHGLDVLAAPGGSEALQGYIDFFSQVRGRPGLRKGILKVRR